MSIKIVSVLAYFFSAPLWAITIILDPAGDAKNPGRSIGATFERTATLYVARHIKEHITRLDKKSLVLFARMPGEQVEAVEKYRLVQQCKPDLFVHLALYQSSDIKPQIHLYCNAPGPVTNNLLTCVDALQHAYAAQSKKMLEAFYSAMQPLSRSCTTHAPFALPSCMLKGISSPAWIIEIGVKDTDDLAHCITPLAEHILNVCKEYSR